MQMATDLGNPQQIDRTQRLDRQIHRAIMQRQTQHIQRPPVLLQRQRRALLLEQTGRRMGHRRDGRVQRRMNPQATGQVRKERPVVAQIIPGIFDLEHRDQRGAQPGRVAAQGPRRSDMNGGIRAFRDGALRRRITWRRRSACNMVWGAILRKFESSSATADAGDPQTEAPTAGRLFLVALPFVSASPFTYAEIYKATTTTPSTQLTRFFCLRQASQPRLVGTPGMMVFLLVSHLGREVEKVEILGNFSPPL